MDSQGILKVNFDTIVNNFIKPSDDNSNPRICLALREVGTTLYDIGQLSMLTFKTNAWAAKDGSTTDPQLWCGKPFETDGESDIDWVVEPVALPYNANEKTLNAKFYRKNTTTSRQDLALQLEIEYEYLLVYGVYTSKDYDDTNKSKGKVSASGKIKFLSASYEKALNLVMSSTVALTVALYHLS